MEAFTLPPTHGCLLANNWSSGSDSISPSRVDVLMIVLVRGDTVSLGACVGERTKSVGVSAASRLLHVLLLTRITESRECFRSKTDIGVFH